MRMAWPRGHPAAMGHAEVPFSRIKASEIPSSSQEKGAVPVFFGPTLRSGQPMTLVLALLVLTVAFGIQLSFGVFVKPLEAEFGWSRATISWAAGISRFCASMIAPLAGWFTDRYGPRIIVSLGMFLMGLGLVLGTSAHSPWQVYTYYSLMVGVGVGCTSIPIQVTVARLFTARRGLALGVAGAGMGLGPVVMAPLAGRINEVHGWETSFAVMGGTAWAMVLAAQLFRADGLMHRQHLQHTDTAVVGEESVLTTHEVSLRRSVQMGAFWLLALVGVCGTLGTMMVMYHLVAFAEDSGIPSVTASIFLSVLGATSIAGRVIVGMASDRIGRGVVFVSCMVLQAVMMLWLTQADATWVFYVFAGIWGFAFGGLSPAFAAMVAETFGLRHMGVIFGLLTFIMAVSGLGSPTLAGYLVDIGWSYSGAFTIGAGSLIASAVAVVFLRRRRAPSIASRAATG